jgi:hypothetical protein
MHYISDDVDEWLCVRYVLDVCQITSVKGTKEMQKELLLPFNNG